jgi:hypothetical protein
MTDDAVLLVLRRTFGNAMTFCAFEKVHEPTTAEKRRREQRSFYEMK